MFHPTNLTLPGAANQIVVGCGFYAPSAEILYRTLPIPPDHKIHLGKLHAEKGWLFLMDNNVERWVSMKEITEYLGVSRDTVLDWIDRRSMPAAKIGRLWKFKISEVDAWMKSGVAAEQ